MSEYNKHLVPRPELRERIIDTAVESFSAHGIKSITMDDIATSLGISKRTLYEVFSDKETLLEECILKGQKEGDEFLKNVLATSGNVLEVLLKCYQRSIEQFHATNKKFFEDITENALLHTFLKEVYRFFRILIMTVRHQNRGRTSWKRLSGNTVKRLCLQTMTRKPNRITINSL